VLSFVFLALLHIPFPVPLAFFTAVTKIFPIIGPWVGGAPSVLIAGLIDPKLGIAIFVLYVALHQVENYFVVPKVMQHAMGLHPFVVLLAILIGSKLLGIAGIIVALPVAAGIQISLKHLWLPHLVEQAVIPSEMREQDP
jgi:predicted PurR-regulated permease PerM